jgi:NAD(P)-dependent dehydrogenase (short-subunit alcohol dehydrogenase family)
MADAEMDEFAEHTGQARQQAYGTVTSLVPQGRPAEPEEVAHAMCWLPGPHASYVNGTSITIDGGTTMVDPGTVPLDFEVRPRQ